MRILITGGPRTGKTTLGLELARRYGCPCYHTDDAIPLGWHEASAEAARWLDRPAPWITEGVAVPRALRKWMAAHEGPPADELIVLRTPRVELHQGQIRMMRAVLTVLQEIAPALRARGLEIVSQ